MDPSLRAHRDAALGLLERLILRGRHISDRLKTTPDSTVDIRSWQQDCAVAINELSGGSKAHWLARAFSGAFLVRSGSGGPGGPGSIIVEATPGEIVDRLLDVLAQARASLASIDDGASATAPPPRRFDFVHNAELRPVLERAYVDSRQAFDAGRFDVALLTSCSILEAIITDALEHRVPRRGGACSAPGADQGRPLRPDATESINDWSFEARIAAAERAGLIRGGCARLPPVARSYRNLTDASGELRSDVQVSEREARLVGQVLRVIMRDLDPGR